MTDHANSADERKTKKQLVRELKSLRRKVADTDLLLAELICNYKEAPVGLCCFDTNLRFLHINDWLAAINGMPVEEHLGRTISEVLPDVAAGVESQLRHVIETGEPIIGGTVDAETPAHPGLTRTFEHNYLPIKSGDDTVVGVSCVVQDITERKRAEEELRQSEAELRAIISNSPFAITLKDVEGRYLFISRPFERLLGVSSGDAVGKTSHELFPNDFADSSLAHDRAVLDSGEAVEREEELKFNVSVRVFLTAKFPIFSADGTIGAIGAIHTDITKRKRAEDALRESEERLAEAQRIAQTGHWEWNVTTSEEKWSDQIYRILGLSPDAGTSHEAFANALHPDDRDEALRTIDKALKETSAYEIEFRIVRPDGTIRHVHSAGEVIRSFDGTPVRVLGTAQDITERKRAEEELRDLGARLITAREEEARHIARELHDEIGQSLALLTIELELFAQAPPEGTDEVIGRLQRLATQCKGLATGIHDLSHRLHPVALEQLGLTAAVRRLCKELSNRHHVRIGFSQRRVPTSIPRNIALCIYRVTQDALSNVMEHSGSRIARVEITGSSKAIRLRISDSGVGFEPTSAKGAGLGLISMRERLRLVEGEITVQSRPSHGTRIDARVPLPPPAPQN